MNLWSRIAISCCPEPHFPFLRFASARRWQHINRSLISLFVFVSFMMNMASSSPSSSPSLRYEFACSPLLPSSSSQGRHHHENQRAPSSFLCLVYKTDGMVTDGANNKTPVTFAHALHLMQSSSVQFVDALTRALTDMPLEAMLFETPPVTRTSAEYTNFEFVVHDAPPLYDATPDTSAFFPQHADKACDGFAVFPNLGKDATLVSPCPSADNPDDDAVHLVKYLRNAGAHNARKLWSTVAQAVQRQLSEQPLWVSTNGYGVSWLHVRLDSSPKYYSYRPYRNFD